MTPEQFGALATLARLSQNAPSTKAAEAVLVGGVSVSDAAKSHGITRQACNQTVVNIRRTNQLAQTASGTDKKSNPL